MGRYNTTELKTEKYTLGDKEFIFTELSGKDMKAMTKNNFKEEDGLISMVFMTLKQTDKDVTVKDIEDLPFSILTEMITIIGKLNE